ncbi:hypothetical protein K437DRAFT_130129 [Tilletiaria anomala UBC 951]|uniref:PB1 domain-containing protein n=1 Tax=Tilletiaria anomala (strain ATCC 24038 / CBS 436.72 / UBC 951) TaxID=1037660 RepID=A0A066W1V1_TILAU|nr:uncharacterized protein K437DRAFT_130129 [Tilletiaria anomala UBC 951]KDN44760.1 hypothetical protein K437DRAFT_130129 [Tilletiaria anomala UBC 951]
MIPPITDAADGQSSGVNGKACSDSSSISVALPPSDVSSIDTSAPSSSACWTFEHGGSEEASSTVQTSETSFEGLATPSTSISAHCRAPPPLSIPLIVKCSSDNRLKRLRFPCHRSVTYHDFRARIARSFQLLDDWSHRMDLSSARSGGHDAHINGFADGRSEYSPSSSYCEHHASLTSSSSMHDCAGHIRPNDHPGRSRTTFDISYTDDDGEECEISSEDDLQEAIAYFTPSTLDEAFSSESSTSFPSHLRREEQNQQRFVQMKVVARLRTAITLSDWGTDLDLESEVGSLINSSYSGYSSYSSQHEHARMHISNGHARAQKDQYADGSRSPSGGSMGVLSHGSYSGYNSSSIVTFGSQSPSISASATSSLRKDSNEQRYRNQIQSERDPRQRLHNEHAREDDQHLHRIRKTNQPQYQRQVRFNEEELASAKGAEGRDADLDSLHYSDLHMLGSGEESEGEGEGETSSSSESGGEGDRSSHSDEAGAPFQSFPSNRSNMSAADRFRIDWRRRRSEPAQVWQGGLNERKLGDMPLQLNGHKPHAGKKHVLTDTPSTAVAPAVTDGLPRVRAKSEPGRSTKEAQSSSPCLSATSLLSGQVDPFLTFDEGLSQLGRRSDADTQSVQLFGSGLDPLDLDDDAGEESDDSRGTISRSGGGGSRPASRGEIHHRGQGRLRSNAAGTSGSNIAPEGVVRGPLSEPPQQKYSDEDMRLLQIMQQKPCRMAAVAVVKAEGTGIALDLIAEDRPDECSCRCSICSTPFQADSLRYVCDTCGPRRASLSASSATSMAGSSGEQPQVAEDGWAGERLVGEGQQSTPTSRASACVRDDLMDDLPSAWSQSQVCEVSSVIPGVFGDTSHETEEAVQALREGHDGGEGGEGERGDDVFTRARRSSNTSSAPQIEGCELCLVCIAEHGSKHVAEYATRNEKRHTFFELVYQDGVWRSVGERRG